MEQLAELKEALEEGEKELVESLEEKDKKIGQLKRALDDNEYLHQTKEDDLYLRTCVVWCFVRWLVLPL